VALPSVSALPDDARGIGIPCRAARKLLEPEDDGTGIAEVPGLRLDRTHRRVRGGAGHTIMMFVVGRGTPALRLSGRMATISIIA
jgi:hypothetical protein